MALVKLNATQGLTGTLPAVSGANLTGVSAGKVLQVVTATSGTNLNTNSTTFVASSITANITPSATSSKIYVSVCTDLDSQTNNQAFATIFRDSTNLASGTDNFGSNFVPSGRVITPLSMSVLDSPNTTSQITYAGYAKSGSNSVTCKFNNQNVTGTITLMEIEG